MAQLAPTSLPLTKGSAIVVERLQKSYDGRAVVQNLSFEVRAGEVFALLGPNGAGKTTTIEILEGYRQPDGGSAHVLGLDPQRQKGELYRRIGIMLQQGGFYPSVTPIEAIRLFAKFYEKPQDPVALLQLVGLDDATRTRYRRLSGGQKQRLSLAVALVGRPELVFLDEPTAGMDPQARHATWEIIRSLKERGVTVILTTHLLDEAERLADRVAIIDRGRLIALGSPAELTAADTTSDIWLTASPGLDRDSLATLSAVKSVRETEPGQYVFETDRALDLLVELAEWLRTRGVMPRALRFGQGSLEDVFLRLTDRGAPS
ncbi:MAG TPA: ABC transporter ATP-binding protein [Chloroflexota bacterium]|nr:ABC transporter ATP-binding protein [Chloroflexota bacterium]